MYMHVCVLHICGCLYGRVRVCACMLVIRVMCGVRAGCGCARLVRLCVPAVALCCTHIAVRTVLVDGGRSGMVTPALRRGGGRQDGWDGTMRGAGERGLRTRYCTSTVSSYSRGVVLSASHLTDEWHGGQHSPTYPIVQCEMTCTMTHRGGMQTHGIRTPRHEGKVEIQQSSRIEPLTRPYVGESASE